MSQQTSTGWIKVLLAIGAMGTILGIILPILVTMTFVKEAQRFVDCEEGKRQDCDPSFAWLMFGPSLMADRMAIEAEQTTSEERGDTSLDDRSTRSSSEAPRIVSVALEGMMLDSGIYRAKAGTSIDVVVSSIDAATVEFYYIPSSSSQEEKVALLAYEGVSKEDIQTFRSQVTIRAGWSGAFEVRALNNEGESTTLLLRVMAQ